MAEGAIGGAIGGGVSAELATSGTSLASSTSANGLSWSGDAVQGAVSYVGNDVAAKLTDQSAHFSWVGLVASSLSSVASGELGPTRTDQQIGNQASNELDTIAAAAAGGVVDREVSVALGDRNVPSWAQIGENVAGTAIGSPIGQSLSYDAVQGIRAYRANQLQQGQTQLNATEDKLLANTQAELNNAIWGSASADVQTELSNNGQAALNDAWGQAQSGINSGLGTGAMAGLGNGAWAGSGVNDNASALSGDSMLGSSGATGSGVAYSGMPLSGHAGAYANYLVAPEGAIMGGAVVAKNIAGISPNQGDMPITLAGYSSSLETNADGTPFQINGMDVTNLTPMKVSAPASGSDLTLDTGLSVQDLVPPQISPIMPDHPLGAVAPNVTIDLPGGSTYTLPSSVLSGAYQLSNSLQEPGSDVPSLSNDAYAMAADKLQAAYSDLMSNPNLVFQDKWDASAQLPGSIINSLTTQWGFPVTSDQVTALNAQNAGLQRANNLFDPQASTLFVNSFAGAGSALAAFSSSASQANSVNPIPPTSGPTDSNTSTFSNSNPESLGFEKVGTIYVANQSTFTAISEAYGAAQMENNGGFNTDALETDRESHAPEVPVNYLGNGSLVVASNAVDALNFLTRTNSYYQSFTNLGQVNVYMKDNQMYFEVITNRYSSQLNNFISSNPPTNSIQYQQVMQGLQHGH